MQTRTCRSTTSPALTWPATSTSARSRFARGCCLIGTLW